MVFFKTMKLQESMYSNGIQHPFRLMSRMRLLDLQDVNWLIF